jgi:hypothetical protein
MGQSAEGTRPQSDAMNASRVCTPPALAEKGDSPSEQLIGFAAVQSPFSAGQARLPGRFG